MLVDPNYRVCPTGDVPRQAFTREEREEHARERAREEMLGNYARIRKIGEFMID